MTEDHERTPLERTDLIKLILEHLTLGSLDPTELHWLNIHIKKLGERFKHDADIQSPLNELRLHVDELNYAASINDLEAQKNAIESALAANQALRFIIAQKERG